MGLQYAANARRMAEVLGPRLAQAGYTPDFTMLVSDETQKQPTKDKIRAAIEGLAGKSTPDDVVVVSSQATGTQGSTRHSTCCPVTGSWVGEVDASFTWSIGAVHIRRRTLPLVSEG